ncbi:MAG: hypothetical protein F6K16_42635 [Symploca sp. SIO2B6]|nr:hypothetical protein [Symploca sp. SIO2B6]
MLRLLSGLGELRRLLLGCQGQWVGQYMHQSVWHLGNPVIGMGDSLEGSDASERFNPIATMSYLFSHYFYRSAKYRKKSC